MNINTADLSEKPKRRLWKPKRDIRWIVLSLVVVVLFFYHRPIDTSWLSYNPYEDLTIYPTPGVSAWASLNNPQGVFGHDYANKNIYESLDSIEETLQRDFNSRHRDDYTRQYTNRSWTQKLYKLDNIAHLFVWSTGQDIQDHLDTLDEILSGHTLEPLNYDYNSLMPSFSRLQSLTRVGALYAMTQCVEWEIDQCSQNFVTLFDLTQKLKRGGMAITALIAVNLEWEVLDGVKHLLDESPEAAQSILARIAERHYEHADNTYEYMIKSEYQAFKHFVQQVPYVYHYDYYGYGILDAAWSIWSDSITSAPTDVLFDHLISIGKTFHLPLSWIYNVPETLTFGELYFSQVLRHPEEAPRADEFIARRPGPARSRSNPLGRMLLSNLIDAHGLYARLTQAQEKFENLIAQ